MIDLIVTAATAVIVGAIVGVALLAVGLLTERALSAAWRAVTDLWLDWRWERRMARQIASWRNEVRAMRATTEREVA